MRKAYTLDNLKTRLERYCAYQERCHQEVQTKLRQLGAFRNDSDAVISHLIQNDYLNETRFAQSFARGKFRVKKWGKLRVKRELKARQISEYNIKLGLKEIPESEYNTAFWALFEKRKEAVKAYPLPVQKKKILSYMMYRGWETQKIYEALREL